MRKIRRWTGSTWSLVFAAKEVPLPAVPYSALTVNTGNYVGSETQYYSGDNLRLTRGNWTNTPTTFNMYIQKSSVANSGYSTANSATGLTSSTSTTFISYTVSLADAVYGSYYIKGLVQATNSAGTGDLETAAILTRINMTLSTVTVNTITGSSAKVNWTGNVKGNSTEGTIFFSNASSAQYIDSQKVSIRDRTVGSATYGQVIAGPFSVTPGTVSYTATGLQGNKTYDALVEIVANDSYYNDSVNGPTSDSIYSDDFVTLAPTPTSPTSITAANNGSYNTVSISWSGASNANYYRVRWVGYQDTSIDPATYYDKQITASSSTSGSWNWGPSDPDKDGAVPYNGTTYYYHVSSSSNGTTWSPYTVSSTAVGTVPLPAPTIISGYEPVNTNTSNTRNFSVTTGSWNNSPTGYSYQWKAQTYLPYPPYVNTVNVGTNSSSYSGISTYDGYSIYCVVTATNAGPSSGTATSNSITQAAPGVAPSGGGVTLTPAGTQMAGTVISANVTAMSGTSPITYVTTIRKETGSSPTGTAAATTPRSGLTNPGTGTGNAVAQHEITTGEASGTPDQFKAYTVGTNNYGSFTVGSNTVISTPYVATQYTVTWDANGGTGGTTTTFDAGTAHSAPAATRSGYTLSNWRNPQTGGDPIFVSAGGTYTPTASITFWAQWTAVVVSAPSGGTATSTPSTGTAGTTTYVGSTSGWSGSPTSYTYSWQYFSQSSFSWVQYSSGTNFSPPAGINTTYPNYGWQLSVGATNSGGTTYATTSITVSNPAVVTAPSTPTGLALTGSGAVSWDAVSGATSYEVLTYTDRTGSPANNTNRLGPYTATGITGTTYQLSSTDNYASPNNYARVQVRARNSAGVSTYSAWVPSSTTYT